MRPRKRINERQVQVTDQNPKVKTFNYYGNSGAGERRQSNDRRVSVDNLITDKKKTFFKERIGFVFLCITFIVCLFWISKLSNQPNIKFNGENQGAYSQKVNHELMISAQKLFSSSIFNSNKITVNTNYITSQLEAQFPQYDSINIDIPLLDHKPVIYLTPAIPTLILNSGSNQYLISSTGAAILQSTSNQGFNNINLPIVNDLSGYKIKIGKLALTQNDVLFITNVIYQLKAKGIIVSYISLPGQSREADVYISNSSYYVKFNLESGQAIEQAGTFLASLNYTKTHNINVTSYYDVRVSGRAYFK